MPRVEQRCPCGREHSIASKHGVSGCATTKIGIIAVCDTVRAV
jgi:hypothetical protein